MWPVEEPVPGVFSISSNSNTKVSKGQVQLLSEGLTRGHGVRLTCLSMHLHSIKYRNKVHFNNAQTDLPLHFVFEGGGGGGGGGGRSSIT